MSRRPLMGAAVVVVAGLLVVGMPAIGTSAPHPGPDPGDVTPAQRLGFQQVPKQMAAARDGSSPHSNTSKGANPLIALLPDPAQSDYAYWRSVLSKTGKTRAAQRSEGGGSGRIDRPIPVAEREGDNTIGSNDSPGSAQYIRQFGTAATRRPAARIAGTMAPGPRPIRFPPAPEDNGSILLAKDLGLSRSRSRSITSGRIGDGPHGSSRDGTGDFDFYKLTSARAGQKFVVDIDTVPADDFDSVVVIWSASGEMVAANDDDGQTTDSRVTFSVPAAGHYYVMVSGFGPTPLPTDPFDSGSGEGAGAEGPYDVTFGLDAEDVDFYGIDLKPGDVVGASVSGVASDLSLFDPARRERIGSTQDASGIYPPSSPLPGGGNAVIAHVADAWGRHSIAVTGGVGEYEITLEVYRPGMAQLDGYPVQTIFLDFDGARVNTAMFGGPGVRQLSPLRAFLGGWGLTAARENALIDQIVKTTTENLKHDLAAPGLAVRILNSRDHRDPFGQPNVSRIIVGGTVNESGVPTIGIAQSIDPGNFELEETALVLLDTLSAPRSGEVNSPSLNDYITPRTNKVRFVGTALGNVVSHEAGHYLGSFHVDQFNSTVNLMDQGGNFAPMFGVGPDNIGGTADDRDVDFGEDHYNPFEGYRGIEDTAANTRWGLGRS